MSNIKEKNRVQLCKYCHKALEKVECSKFNNSGEYSFHELLGFIFWFISLFIDSYKKRLKEHKFKVTCTNKDCIGYLDGCMVNRYQIIWQYPKRKEK